MELLDVCFDSITIPIAVEAELKELALPHYIQRQSVSELGSYYVKGAIGNLHIGELEAMFHLKISQATLRGGQRPSDTKLL